MTEKTYPIREPGSLPAVTVELRAHNKKLDEIVKHLDAGGTISDYRDELRAALAEHNKIMGRYIAALSRI
jgi:hypothetical protein